MPRKPLLLSLALGLLFLAACATTKPRYALPTDYIAPMDKPRSNAVKFFSSTELISLLADPDWLDEATKTIIQFWKRKNARRNGSLNDIDKYSSHV